MAEEIENKQIIRDRTLELISYKLGDWGSGERIIKVLKEWGVKDSLIVYPNTKWRMVFAILQHYAKSPNKKDHELLFKIICESIHPLMYGGDTETTDKIVEDLNKYLFYDGLIILFSDHTKNYSISELKNVVEVDDEEELALLEEAAAENLPDINKSNFTEQVLGLVAEEFGNYLSHFEIYKIITPTLEKDPRLANEAHIKAYLDDWGEEHSWQYNFSTILKTISKKYEDADRIICNIISELLHPLNYKADEYKVERLAKKIEKYLEYNGFYLQNAGKEYIILSGNEMDEIHSVSPEEEAEYQEEKHKEEEAIKQNKETIKDIRESHQSYIDILEIFCRDTKKPTKDLNDAYILLSNRIQKKIGALGLKSHVLSFYKPFRGDLYSAEIEWSNSEANLGKKLSWDAIRPQLYGVHSDIIKIQQISEEGADMTDEEQALEKINNLIAEKRTEKTVNVSPIEKTLKLEITKIPELNIKNREDNIIRKSNKRVVLPKFPRTEWSKVSITFLGERDILLSDNKENKPSSFQGLGCEDTRNGKPDANWKFLFDLALGNGQTSPISKNEREKKKKQKQRITDILRKMFKNETDPFETEKGGVYKAKFNIKHNFETAKKSVGKYADAEDVFSELTEPVNDGDFSQ